MSHLTIDEAARQVRRNPRELRLLIESGELAASRREGRWIIDRDDLERLTSPSPPPTGRAEPAERQGFGELFARLRSLAGELSALRAQLDRAERRIAKLEGARGESARPDAATPSPLERKPTMRDALHPLFGRTEHDERERRQ